MSKLRCGRFEIDLARPQIMAIVNLTDDSFSGDGLHGDLSAALRKAEAAVGEGADMLDIGAESTRPGSDPVPEQQEVDRIVPLIEALAGWKVPLSIDTLKPAVMRAAIAAGADLINDVNGFRAPGAVEAVAGSDAALCVMHMQGEPRTMQVAPQYGDVLADVAAFLDERLDALDEAGVAMERIVLDPGFGFGKTLEHNLALMKGLDVLARRGLPVLAGLSRKTMLGAITGKPVGERMAASVTAAMIAVQRGASILRVHDVAPTRDALLVLQAMS